VEIEKSGIPTVQISTMTPVALMVGSTRVVLGHGIVHPLGDVDLDPETEKKLRRAIVEKALEALKTETQEQLMLKPDL
jgi:glycine/betaine/sarcosine/D-proline reductase family selenoprotein B